MTGPTTRQAWRRRLASRKREFTNFDGLSEQFTQPSSNSSKKDCSYSMIRDDNKTPRNLEVFVGDDTDMTTEELRADLLQLGINVDNVFLSRFSELLRS